MLARLRRDQRAVDEHRRQGSGDPVDDLDPAGEAGPVRIDDVGDELRAHRPARGARSATTRSSRTPRRSAAAAAPARGSCVTQLFEHGAQRLAAVGVHAAQCSADSWIGVSGFLISCATCRAISAQASSRCVRSSCVRCALSSAAMLLKASTSRRSSSDDLTAIRASKSPRAMRRVARVSRRTGSAMRSAIDSPIAGAEQDEEQRARDARRDRARRSRARFRAAGASGTVRIAFRPPARTGAAASM